MPSPSATKLASLLTRSTLAMCPQVTFSALFCPIAATRQRLRPSPTPPRESRVRSTSWRCSPSAPKLTPPLAVGGRVAKRRVQSRT